MPPKMNEFDQECENVMDEVFEEVVVEVVHCLSEVTKDNTSRSC